jgi:hypothetical protein
MNRGGANVLAAFLRRLGRITKRKGHNLPVAHRRPEALNIANTSHMARRG